MFKIIDKKTNEEIFGAFVLIPAQDSAARIAVAAYAEATAKPKIARWLRKWLQEIHKSRSEKRRIEENFSKKKEGGRALRVLLERKTNEG